MHYRMAPGDISADPVLFFHRTPVTSASFAPVMKRLSGWKAMVAFDTPGFGESFTPDDSASMTNFIAYFTAAIDQIGIRNFHLVGHHTGAHFAAELAAAMTDRALSLMLDGAMVTTDAERAAMLAPPPTVVEEDGLYAQKAWRFLRPYYTVFDQHCIHTEFVGALASIFTRNACMNVVRTHDMAAVIAKVACPLFVTAATDDVFAPHLNRIKAIQPAAHFEIYGNAGIASPELQTEEFSRLVRLAAGHI